MSNNNNLQIFKASAGSGKTFNITREYLKLIFAEKYNYSSILAVTFTNKATAEMKERIISELQLLSNNGDSGHKEVLLEHFRWSPSKLQAESKKVLSLILHNFDLFSVSTIDSFFQKVIRSFSREVRLHSNYNAELNTGKVLNEAIERLFENINSQKSVKEWLITYAQSKISNGENWNFQTELEKRAGLIIKEEYQLLMENPDLFNKLKDYKYLNQYRSELEQYVENFKAKAKEIGEIAIATAEAHSLSIDNFPYKKSGFFGFFTKLVAGDISKIEVTARVEKALEGVDNWYKKSEKPALKGRIEAAYDDGLQLALETGVRLVRGEGRVIKTIQMVLPQLYSLGILHEIARNIEEITKEKNIILISDSVKILRGIIGDYSTPFIYEKIGNRYQHFMLDEFQDTSDMQWQNFTPLIENSLGEGGNVTVVGDVKQSIYRWRGGDWQLLSYKLPSDLKQFNPSQRNLGTNWRSSKNVIGFNNTLFHSIPEMVKGDILSLFEDKDNDLPSMITNAYEDSFQKYSGKDKDSGYVELSFCESDDLFDWRERTISEVIERIEDLQLSGFAAGDIAILVRKAQEGREIAKAIMEKGEKDAIKGVRYNVVSQDSLQLGSSYSLRFIISVVKQLSTATRLGRADMLNLFYNYLLPQMDSENQNAILYYASPDTTPDLFSEPSNSFTNSDSKAIDNASIFFEDEELPSIFKYLTTDSSFINQPLYELIESIISLFKLNTIATEEPYIFSLLDIVLSLVSRESYTTSSLIEWWEETGVKMPLSAASSNNAINLYTIHKSKGLEFPVVLLPFCNWDIYPDATKENIVWCSTNETPLEGLPMVPIKFKKDMGKTIFSDLYNQEMVLSAVDNLNLLYVALTRAETRLYIWGEKEPEKETKSSKTKRNGMQFKSVSDLLYRSVSIPHFMDSEDRNKYVDFSNWWDEEERLLSFGIPTDKIDSRTDNSKTEGNSTTTLSKSSSKLTFNRGKSIKFLRQDKRKSLQTDLLKNKKDLGIIIHEVFEKIDSVDNISEAIQTIQFEGRINSYEAKVIEKDIVKLLNSEHGKRWFTPDKKIFNERQIILKGGKILRPDRIVVDSNSCVEVIDYKTGEEHEQHKLQIQGYIKAIKEMGYKNVVGYIWYTTTDSVVECGAT